MIGLSALASYVYAIGFIELGGFFVSFMSGNSTRLGGRAYRALARCGGGYRIDSAVRGRGDGGFAGGQICQGASPPVVLMLVAALLLVTALGAAAGVT